MSKKQLRAAYNRIRKQNLLSPARFRVYDDLYRHGPSTAGEVTARLSTSRTANPSFHRRLAELVRLGVACRRSPKTCDISGRRAVVWALTGELPRNPTLPRSPKGILKESLYLGLTEVYFLIHRYRRVNPDYSAPKHLDDLCRWLARRGTGMSAVA